jgi:phosphoribosylglycinamide formyltransferase-1
MNIGFLASGRGSNMQAVIDACKAGSINAKPALVISNNSKSGAIERAEQEGIPHAHLSSKAYPDPDDLDQAMLDKMLEHNVDLIMLAGYMKKMGTKTLSHYKGKVINIHPALLPKFGGEGMYGMNVHKAVIAGREKETGVTIHVVDEEYDTGPIIAQSAVPVMEDDTAETLAARVLEREHSFLVETLAKLTAGEISLP